MDKLEPIPDYGDHMTLQEFKKTCVDGCFIDYDGTGYYATEEGMSTIPAYPSDMVKGVVRDDFTHVVWFNK